ncbi:MAG: sulfatase-like hydrolase/transferase, partial [Planctomycetota bacterium]
ICTPSRVMIMTGKYNFRNYTHFGYLNPAEKTFGNLLHDAGYKTAVAGKWQLNGLYNNLPGYDDNQRPVRAGFDEYCLWQLTKARTSNGERFWSPLLEQNGKLLTPEDTADQYGPDIFCDFLCDFMRRHVDEPFFLYYPMVLVHNPFVPTPDTIGDAPRSQVANKPAGKNSAKENFVAMVNYMDKIVGRIVSKTETLGIAEKTLVIFTADNGTNVAIRSRWNGMEIQGGKASMTDMGTHVPMIAYHKGRTPVGKVIRSPVDFTDIYPTLADAAGITLDDSDPRDGISLLPQLYGKGGLVRDWVYCHYQPYWRKIPGQFIRTSRYKLYRDGRFFEPAVDLKEEVDLSGSLEEASQWEVFERLRSVLELAPPAPTEKNADKNTKDRPVYPDWERLPIRSP